MSRLKISSFLSIFCLTLLYGNNIYAQSNHFTPVDPTGTSDAVIIQNATINGTPIVAGDEIAVFDGTLCVGAAVFSGLSFVPQGVDRL